MRWTLKVDTSGQCLVHDGMMQPTLRTETKLKTQSCGISIISIQKEMDCQFRWRKGSLYLDFPSQSAQASLNSCTVDRIVAGLNWQLQLAEVSGYALWTHAEFETTFRSPIYGCHQIASLGAWSIHFGYLPGLFALSSGLCHKGELQRLAKGHPVTRFVSCSDFGNRKSTFQDRGLW